MTSCSSGGDGEEKELKFITRMPSEVRKIIWELKDFKSLIQVEKSLEELRLHFEVGSSIGIPSKWSFCLRRDKERIDIYLELNEAQKLREEQNFVKFSGIVARHDGSAFSRNYPVVTDMTKSESLKWLYAATISSVLSEEANLLVNGSLVINFEVTMYSINEMNTLEAHSDVSSLRALSQSAIVDDLHQVLISKLNSDVMIETRDLETFRAHRLILAARSPVFLAMFESNMLESSTQCIRIDDIGSETMKIVLQYIYSGSLNDDWINEAKEVIYAAEKYNLPLLKKFCDQTFIKASTDETAYDCLKLAKLYGLDNAIKDIEEYIRMNIASILKT